MKKATILSLVAALLAVACAGKKNNAGELSAVQLPFENSGWKMSEVADSIQYIPLGTPCLYLDDCVKIGSCHFQRFGLKRRAASSG